MKKKLVIALVLVLAVLAGLAIGLWQMKPDLFGGQENTVPQIAAPAVNQDALARAQARVAALERETALLRQRLTQSGGLTAEVGRLKEQLTQTQGELARVKAELAACRQQMAQTQDQAPEMGHVSQTIYYRPGQSGLSKQGLGIVKQTAQEIRAVKNPEVRVEGHADSMPMRPTTREKYGDNLGLSVVRSLVVARELFKQGVPVEKVVVVGYGTTDPVKGPKVKGEIINNRRCVIRYFEKD